MGLFGRSRADKLGAAIDIAGLREQAAAQDPSYMPPAPNPGAFSRGGAGWQVLGAIGDSLSQMGGYGAPFAQARNFQRQQQLEEAQWTRRQESELAQRKAMHDYERANPAPRYFEANNGDQFMIGPDGQPKLVYHDPTPKVQWQRVENGDGTFTMVPIVNGQIAGGNGQQARTAPPGVTFTPLPDGGPTHPASGGFPRR